MSITHVMTVNSISYKISDKYSRFSKILNTICMPKWLKQTTLTQISLLPNLIRLWDVCCSDNYFVNFSPDNQHLFKNREFSKF